MINHNSNESEKHPIYEGFIPENATILIVGTFPPKKVYAELKEDFFYYSSSYNHFWNRIDNIFNKEIGYQQLKKTKLNNNNEKRFENKKRKQTFMASKNIGFIDVFSEIYRTSETSND